MPTLTALGVGSGLDITSLVSQLVAAERTPVEARLARQEASVQAKLSAFGTLRSALAQFQAALAKLTRAGDFLTRSATSADQTVFTVSAGSTAAAGSYEVEVLQTAQAHRLMSGGFADAGAVVGTGTLTLAVGGESFNVVVDDSNKTLAGLRDAINEAAENTGVGATLVNGDDGLGGTVTRLVLTATETGLANAIQVTAVDADGNHSDAAGLSALVYVPGVGGTTNLTGLRAAQDAVLRIDGNPALPDPGGITVTRATNQISDAIEGVTLTLAKASPGTNVALAVAVDPSAAKGLVQGFVTAYNQVLDAIRQVASYNAATGQAMSLFGDSTVRGLESRLRAEVTNAVASAPGGLARLLDIGISTGENGNLAIDSADLDAALDADLESVAGLFAAGDGYANRFEALVSAYIDSDGAIAARTDGLDARVKDIAAQREALERRIESLEARYLRQFTALDELVSRLQSTGSFLTQQLASLQSLTTRQGSR